MFVQPLLLRMHYLERARGPLCSRAPSTQRAARRLCPTAGTAFLPWATALHGAALPHGRAQVTATLCTTARASSSDRSAVQDYISNYSVSPPGWRTLEHFFQTCCRHRLPPKFIEGRDSRSHLCRLVSRSLKSPCAYTRHRNR